MSPLPPATFSRSASLSSPSFATCGHDDVGRVGGLDHGLHVHVAEARRELLLDRGLRVGHAAPRDTSGSRSRTSPADPAPDRASSSQPCRSLLAPLVGGALRTSLRPHAPACRAPWATRCRVVVWTAVDVATVMPRPGLGCSAEFLRFLARKRGVQAAAVQNGWVGWSPSPKSWSWGSMEKRGLEVGGLWRGGETGVNPGPRPRRASPPPAGRPPSDT